MTTKKEEKGTDEKYCSSCGEIIKAAAEICPKCGVRQPATGSGAPDISEKWLVSLLLCIFIGFLGAHRFYVGKTGTGILMLLTGGGCGIWVIIDLILILTQKFTDKSGCVITSK